jgi:hypothetical protein
MLAFRQTPHPLRTCSGCESAFHWVFIAICRLDNLRFGARGASCRVIGNSAYKSVPRLANPVNGAALVGGMFKKAGFDGVDIKLDLSGSICARRFAFAG